MGYGTPFGRRRSVGRRVHSGPLTRFAGAIRHAPPHGFLEKSRGLRPRALSARTSRETAPLCLFSLRRRPADLHRQPFRNDGSRADSGVRRLKVAAQSRPRCSGDSPTACHAPPKERPADEYPATIELISWVVLSEWKWITMTAVMANRSA